MVPLKRLRAAASTALLFAIVACQGNAPNSQGFAPYGPQTTAARDRGGVTNLHKDVDIKSSCGRRIHVVVLAFVDCRFHERGYNGMFTIHDHTNGLVTISPTQGNRRTKFTITGVLVGSGYFVVTDAQKNKLRVRVRVTL